MGHDFERLERKMDIIIRLLILNIRVGEQTAMTVKEQLQAILDEVHAESTPDASMGALIKNLQDNAADPAMLSQILDGMKANQSALTSAVLSTPPAPAPVVAPAEVAPADPPPVPATA